MQLHPLKLVTIVIEQVMKEKLLQHIVECGATGFTLRGVSGFGSRGARHGPGGENVKVEVVCPESVAQAILTYISRNYFEKYACIAWVTDISVSRGAHYVKPH